MSASRWRLCALGLLSMAGASAATDVVAVAGRAMGTTWSVKFLSPGVPLDPEVVRGRVAERLEHLERQFSTYRPSSELSRFNAAATMGWVEVSSELASLVAQARQVALLTGGAFDVTIAPLVALWGFGPRGGAGAVPTHARIEAARARVNWRFLEARMDPPALRKARADTAADLSSLAKGFAADKIGELVASLGIPDYLVQIGGDVKSGGGAAGGTGTWRVGIEAPEADGRILTDIVELAGQALSTSGAYRNFFTAGGRRFGHIIDPRTGEPVASAVGSVSVIADTCAWSSALATALFVLGPDEGLPLAARHGWACQFTIEENGVWVRRSTPAFEQWAR